MSKSKDKRNKLLIINEGIPITYIRPKEGLLNVNLRSKEGRITARAHNLWLNSSRKKIILLEFLNLTLKKLCKMHGGIWFILHRNQQIDIKR